MAALTQDRITDKRFPGVMAYPVAATTKIYAGAIVCVNSTGVAVPAADTAGNKVVGIATRTVDNSAGAAGAMWVEVNCPTIARLNATSITQAMVGTVMHVVDDNTVDDAVGTNTIKAGVLVEFISTTEGWIYINPPATTN